VAVVFDWPKLNPMANPTMMKLEFIIVWPPRLASSPPVAPCTGAARPVPCRSSRACRSPWCLAWHGGAWSG